MFLGLSDTHVISLQLVKLKYTLEFKDLHNSTSE